MSNLSIQSLTMPAVDLGLENPLTPIEIPAPSKKLEIPLDLPDEIAQNIAYGNLSSIYPYTHQDGYDRNLEHRSFQVAVLENEYLQATFLLEFGGRLWSLVHKPSGKELLEVNPVFQLANLALRNAWFSGGVEWNIGTTGHSPFTCSPLFSCRVEGTDEMPILRFFEWERFRQTPFQIDAFLPDESQVLFIRTRICNPNDHPVPIYWWSNIAVPGTPDTRVLVPANSAYCLGCRPDHLSRIDIPINNGIDITYPKLVDGAADFFFELEPASYPWIAALYGDGQGLIQLSTREMVGRKLWVWGSGTGGRNWQKFLSPPGKGYIEIQAGITRTQLEHKQLSPGAACSWLEAYAYLEADPGIVHGKDWTHAFQHVDHQAQKLISLEELQKQYQLSSSHLIIPPVKYYKKGSGWGALECRRRERFSENEFAMSGVEFGDDSLGELQQPWLSLLETGSFSLVDEKKSIGSFVVNNVWGNLIEQALQGQSANNWYAWYQGGIIRYHAGDFSGAEEAWKRSLQITWTPWAARNLALLAWRSGQIDQAANLLVEACRSDSSVLPLVVECGTCLVKAERHEEWLQIVPGLPQSLQTNSRIRLLQAQAALAAGNLDIIEKFFKDGATVADLREGENSISDLWIDFQVQKMSNEDNLDQGDPELISFLENPPVPRDIDFRMRI